MDRIGSGGHRVEERGQGAVEGEGASSRYVCKKYNLTSVKHNHFYDKVPFNYLN
jgi:hypothetical protein